MYCRYFVMPVFVVLMAIVLNFIVHSDCKDLPRKEMLSTVLEEEANFDNLLEVNQHTDKDAQEVIKRKPYKIVRKNFIPIEVLKKLKRVKTLKDFQREFKYNSLEKDFRRTMNDANEVVYLNSVHCAPRPTAVEVPSNSPCHGVNFPDFVLLHRCTGGCTYGQDLTQCVAQKTEVKNVFVYHLGCSKNVQRSRSIKVLPWEEKKTFVKRQQQYTYSIIPMKNHTACACKCIVQASDCDSATQVYEEDICKCVCKDLSSTCNSSYQVWDNEHCHCKCKYDPIACEHDSKLWSPRTCECECLDKFKKRCERKNKLLNHDTCECYCPPDIDCPIGTEIRKSDCKCV